MNYLQRKKQWATGVVMAAVTGMAPGHHGAAPMFHRLGRLGGQEF